MARRHSPGCLCCGCCSQPLEDYVSPNTPKTELTITGNHPAHLVSYFQYIPSYYSAIDDEWKCPGWLFDSDEKCCVGGSGLVDRDESDDLWQDDFCCQFKSSGSLDWEAYFCCDEPPNVGWIKSGVGSFSSKLASSQTITHAVWYRKLAVRFYAGEEDGCCGVWVEVCLSFRRYLLFDTCSARIATTSGSNICPTVPVCGTSTCISQSGSTTCELECEGYDSNSGEFIPCPAALDAEDYIDADDEHPEDDNGLHYSILRRKFVPNTPACTRLDIPLLSVTLGPEHNIDTDFLGNNIGICDVCPDAQELFPGDDQDFCIPDIVYYDRGTVADACCEEAEPASCGGSDLSGGFAAINGYCLTLCDETTSLVLQNSLSLNCVDTGDGETLTGAFHLCYAVDNAWGFNQTVFTTSNRTNTVEDSCSIDACGYLLFGELEDEWELTITLPN